MIKEINNPISERLMKILENRDRTKTKSGLANYLGLSQSMITKWKKTPPNIIYIEKICKYLDVSIEWFITGKGKGKESSFKNNKNLTDEENELINSFRKLDDFKKSEYLGRIKAISKK